MGKTCFLCKEKFGLVSLKFPKSEILQLNLQPPEGMSDADKLCSKCYKENYGADYQVIMEKSKEVELEMKKVEEDAKLRQKEELNDLMQRASEYKKHWNKNGIIQFKNEQIAILKRAWGAQVEFIVAFDDITKEGYRLMAIDEGKEVSAGGISGGTGAYFYFQKMEFVR